MKLKLAGSGFVMVAALFSVMGCSPSTPKQANGPQDVLSQMEAELSRALPGTTAGTTTLTNADIGISLSDIPADREGLSLPEDRGSLAAAARVNEQPATQTWGAGAEPAPPPASSEPPKSIYEP